MINRLHSPAMRTMLTPPNRMSGRTTARCLHAIATAMYLPGTPVAITDHFSGSHARRNAMYVAQRLAAQLGLDLLKFDEQELTVTYGVFE